MSGKFTDFFISALLIGCCSILTGCGERQAPSDADWQKESELKITMRRIQAGVEHYAADHGGDNYPTKMDESFKTYLPGGVEGSEPALFGTINPFSGKNEFLTVDESLKDLHEARYGKPVKLNPGQILYCPLKNGKAYLIVAGGYDGKAMVDDKNPGQNLVLSNLED